MSDIEDVSSVPSVFASVSQHFDINNDSHFSFHLVLRSPIYFESSVTILCFDSFNYSNFNTSERFGMIQYSTTYSQYRGNYTPALHRICHHYFPISTVSSQSDLFSDVSRIGCLLFAIFDLLPVRVRETALLSDFPCYAFLCLRKH